MTKLLFTFLITMLSYYCVFCQEDTNWYPYQDSIGKWSFRSVDGKLFNETYFDTINNFYNGRASVKKNGKWGVISTEGTNIIPFSFTRIIDIPLNGKSFFKIIRKNEEGNLETAIFNSSGRIVVPFSFAHIDDVIVNGKSFFKVSRKTEEGTLVNAIFNSFGKVIVPFDNHDIIIHKYQYGNTGYSKQFRHILDLPIFICETESRQNTVVYSINGEVLLKPVHLNERPIRYYFINNNGIVKNFPKYDYDYKTKHVSKYSIGYDRNPWARRLIISWEKEHMMLDYSGNVIVPLGKYRIEEYSKDTLYFSFQDSTSKWGLIDRDGKIVVEPQFYKPLDNFSTFKIKYPEFNDKIGYDSINSVIFDSSLNSISYPYEEIIPISRKMNKNVYRVKKDGRWGILHGTKEIIPPQWGGIMINESLGLFICSNEGETNVFNLQGKLIMNSDLISFEYSNPYEFGSLRLLVVEKKRKYLYYDLHFKDPTDHVRKVKKAKLHEDWNELLTPYLVSKEPYIVRIYTRRKGFMFVDSLGEPMMSNYVNCGFIDPVIFNEKLIGYICINPDFDFNQSFTDSRQNVERKVRLYLFNGVVIDDNYPSISFNPENEYFLALKDNDYVIYSVKGEKLMSFLLDNSLGNYDSRFLNELAKKDNKYTKRVKEILERTGVSVSRNRDGYYILKNTEGKKIILNIDKETISPMYDKIEKFAWLVICTKSENKNSDILDRNGKLLYSNVKNINSHGRGFYFDLKGIRYWMTSKGQIYMQNEIKF